ncbi:MAG: DUF4340 domain-containing protein [Candidatus Aminicenantes bacterium]|nr:DUF4340 domain-containing protein [Candidatus Aminicenantes bacterium]
MSWRAMMKLQKEFVILIAVICILVLVLIISSGRNKVTYKLPELDRIESDSVDKIEIITSEDSVVLSKKQDEWLLMPQQFTADTEKVNNMLNVVSSINLTELVSDKKNYQRYQLDQENRIHVKAFNDEELVREFFIGKVSSTYSHTYVRLADSPNVYHASDSFRSTFEQNIPGLRDKSVMKFSQDEITALMLKGEFGEIRLKKEIRPVAEAQEQEEQTEVTPQQKSVWLSQDGEEAEASEVNSVLSKLSSLNCDSFLDEEKKQNLENPVYNIIAQGSKDYQLKIFQNKDPEETYPSLSSENAHAFFLTKYVAESLMKKPEDIFKIEDRDK